MATPDEIKDLIKRLITLPNCPITSPETGRIVEGMWNAALRDVTGEWLQAAYLTYITRPNPYFPSNPGVLREIAFELEMTANNVPTASMAWAMVLDGPGVIAASWCDEGMRLREAANDAGQISGEMYGVACRELWKHEDTCAICNPKSQETGYPHPAVTEAVRRMGGRDAIFTDNPVADRARFLDAYKEMVTNERKLISLPPEVQNFITSPNRPQLAGAKMKQLAGKLSTQPQ